ncbi:MAG: oligopeptide transporter, OPT family, partial [Leptonema sp. (in: Bacteria)]|nr:oligopeptide transporter, OPT family [Leptonema sp. (in: bacteria)]
SSGLRNLGFGAVVAAGFNFFTTGLKVLGDSVNIWVTGFGTIFRFSTSFSFALLAAGYLMGVAGGIAVLVGVIFSWGLAVPYLVSTVPVDAGQSLADSAIQIWNSRVRFLGAGVIAIAAIYTVASLIRPIVKSIQQQGKNSDRLRITNQDLSNQWLLVLGFISIAVLFFVVADFLDQQAPMLNAYLKYGLSLVTVVLAVVFGFLVAAACGYMAGLVGSSSSPISGIGIIATILMGLVLLAAHSIFSTLNSSMSAQLLSGLLLFLVSAILAMASVSNDNLQDLKTGYLVGASPKKQQIALIIGCIVGAAVIAPVLNLLYQAYGFVGAVPRPDMNPEQILAAPQAALMQQIGGGIFSGNLDYTMLFVGVGVGIISIAIDRTLRSQGLGALPPLAVGLGIYLPPAVNTMLGFGAVLGFVIKKILSRQKQKQAAREERGLLMASGFIVGESLIGLLMAGLIIGSGNALPLALNLGLGEGTMLLLGGLVFCLVVMFFFYQIVHD